MEFLIFLALGLIGLALGFFVGRTTERNHFRNLDKRESASRDLLVTQIRSFPHAQPTDKPPQLVVAEVVISSDYLKSTMGNLRKLIGGEMRSFGTLLERARRESLLRLKDDARQQGYNALCNVRIETADIGGGEGSQNKIIMAAVIASATAYVAQNSR